MVKPGRLCGNSRGWRDLSDRNFASILSPKFVKDVPLVIMDELPFPDVNVDVEWDQTTDA